MATASSSLTLTPPDEPPAIRVSTWDRSGNDGGTYTHAAITFEVSGGEVALNAPADMLAQLLRDALNALGDAVDPVAPTLTCPRCGMPATRDLCTAGQAS